MKRPWVAFGFAFLVWTVVMVGLVRLFIDVIRWGLS